MEYQFYTLDVFTTERFTGNGLAIVMGADGLTDQQMQTVAREFNLSETVFLQTPHDSYNTAKMRIFTPGKELPFAGHPTIGTAVLLAWHSEESCTDIRLEQALGMVPVHVDDVTGDCGYAQLAAPALPEPPRQVSSTEAIAAAIGVEPSDIGFDNHQPHLVKAGNEFLFVPLNSLAAVEKSMVNPAARQDLLGAEGLVGAFVYCRSGVSATADFHGRMFGSPASGIVEDPATGSAVAAFPGQLVACETLEDNMHQWHIEQGFEMGRASDLFLEADIAHGALKAVRVGGHAVTVSHGLIDIRSGTEPAAT
ncbi:MAG: PhzF family phenazine biosynthesis protein [Rhizobiales bacterium]|nr:PhzF family phenazine biosynthesis protein [Hyphomicrobiales bacterium]